MIFGSKKRITMYKGYLWRLAFMSEQNNKKIYSRLDELSIEQLQNLLREDFESSDDVDMGYITAILDVIEKRNKENDTPVEFNTAEKWQELEEKIEHITPETPQKITQITETKYPRGKRKIWQTVAAALVFISLCGIITAQAFGYNIFNRVVQWTDELFTFGDPGEVNVTVPLAIEIPPDYEFDTMEEILNYLLIHHPFVPRWIPDGFIETELSVVQLLPERSVAHILYQDEDRVLVFHFTVYYIIQDGFVSYYEKDDTPIEELIIHGITHYIMSNNVQNGAVWTHNNVEAGIYGHISKEDIIKMIHSIYEE